MATTNYTVTINATLRTLTVNDRFTWTVNTATLSTGCDAVAVQLRDIVEDQALTFKSLQGHASFSNVAGRTLGGQATYSTLPPGFDAATPTRSQAVAYTVEPEHRIAFAVGPVDALTPAALSTRLQNIILEGLYEGKLYKH